MHSGRTFGHSGRTIRYNGTTTGWTGQIEWPSISSTESGRHRRTNTSDTWTPTPRRNPAAPSHAAESDPLDDAANGLHAFDLGMVPASVTPPRTWRNAAWFVVASSAAAFFGMVVAASALSGTPSEWRSAEFHGERGRTHGLLFDQGSLSIGAADDYHALTDIDSAPHRPPSHSKPTVSAVPTPSAAPGDNGLGDLPTIRRHTERYFEFVENGMLASAFELTTGGLRAAGYEEFVARYPQKNSFEVIGVSVRPAQAVATLRVVSADGGVSVQRRELRFTVDEETLIDADAPLD